MRSIRDLDAIAHEHGGMLVFLSHQGSKFEPVIAMCEQTNEAVRLALGEDVVIVAGRDHFLDLIEFCDYAADAADDNPNNPHGR